MILTRVLSYRLFNKKINKYRPNIFGTPEAAYRYIMSHQDVTNGIFTNEKFFVTWRIDAVVTTVRLLQGDVKTSKWYEKNKKYQRFLIERKNHAKIKEEIKKQRLIAWLEYQISLEKLSETK